MIYIIRHGQTDQNLAFRIQGQRDFPLNETGEAQTRDAHDKFRELGIEFDRVYTSPLSRARRTAEIVVSAPGTGAQEGAVAEDMILEPGTGAQEGAVAEDMILEPRLIEMDYGPYEGCDLKNLPEEMLYFFKDFKNHPAPDGVEQLPDLVARLGSFLEDLRAQLGDTRGENILLSTHAIAMKAALEYLTPGSDGAYWSKFVKNCAVYRFDLVDGEFTVPEEFL
ncbi:MAG: histidine phosphatase family protein [Clostridiales bacterium]|nr:histidine phosphatase family protein [Clostridiales bacterium]